MTTHILDLAQVSQTPPPIVTNADWRGAFALVDAAGAAVDISVRRSNQGRHF